MEQTASNAQNRNDRRRGRPYSSHNNNNRDDDRRYQPRPRHNNYRGGRGGYHHHHHNNNNHQNQPDRALDGLMRFGYRLPRGPYHRPPPISASADRPFHICLLAISIDELPYEAIWKAWATQKTTTTRKNVVVSLVCHAKHPDAVQSEWLQQRMILQPRRVVRGNSWSDPEFLSHRPEWGSVEITRAMIDLLVRGMEIGRKGDHHPEEESDSRFSPNRFLITRENLGTDELAKRDVPPADKFIFISETCIPVTSLEECTNALFEPTTELKTAKGVSSRSDADLNHSEAKDDPVAKDEQKNEEKTTEKKEESNDGPAAANSTASSSVVTNDSTTNNANPDDKVIHLDISWCNARNFNTPGTPQNKYERDQFNGIHRVVPKRYRWKADQWMVLSRHHAAAVLDLDHSSNIPPKDQLWNSFRRINASDEMYFPTSLALANILIDTQPRQQHHHHYPNQHQHTPPNQQPSNQPQNETDPLPWLKKRSVTYTDWSVGMRNPACFTNGIKDFKNVARLARKQKCLFARKFAPYLEVPGQDPASISRTGCISVEEWQKEMETIQQSEDQQQ